MAEAGRAKERQPVEMVLAGYQPGRAFINSLRDPAVQKAPVVQGKLEQIQVQAGGEA